MNDLVVVVIILAGDIAGRRIHKVNAQAHGA